MKYPWYARFWVWWVGLTLLYLFFQSSAATLPAAGAVGLFVPYGFMNTWALVSAIAVINLLPMLTAVLFVAAVVYSDKVAKSLGIQNTISKIFFNLGILLVVTLIIDLSLWGSWESFHVLLNGGNLKS